MGTLILQIITFQLVFLIIYELLLKKETFFNWNRAYLLITSACSIGLPFVKLKWFSKVVPNDFVVNLPAVIIGQKSASNFVTPENLEMITIQGASTNYIELLWCVGIVFFTSLLVYKLFKIAMFKYYNSSISEGRYTITTLKNSEDAFSFLNIIFLGDLIEAAQKESILKHEKVHAKEKHTLDLLWFEVLRIIFWFNPLIYMFQKRITEVHEFIADKSASKYQKNYYENLLARTFNITQFSVVNQFYSSSLIKKRIVMLTKKQSNNLKLSKYLTIIPVVLGMLIYVSCNDAIESENSNSVVTSDKTTVIEDVIAIVNNTAPFEESENGLSEDQFNTIIGNLKVYKQMNFNKIENTDFNEYTSLHYKLIDLDGEKYENIMKNNKDLFDFYVVTLSTENLLKKLESLSNKDQKLVCIKVLSHSRTINRLEELNYVLPNKEKYLKMVESIEEKSNSNKITFSTIDKAPIFPDSDESLSSELLKKSFSKNISKYVAINFNTKLAKELNLTGRQKILVAFKIDELGVIKDVKARAPHQVLKEEAERVVKSLPVMKPGMHKGKAVTVGYSLPIVFKIEA